MTQLLDYIIQTPELHRIHHIQGKHWGNFSDLIVWDRLFGTYIPRDLNEPLRIMGFRDNLELKFLAILGFKNVLLKNAKEKK